MTLPIPSPAVATSVKPRRSLLKRGLRTVGAFAFGLYILFIILILLLRYLVLPHVTNYRGDIERLASANLKTRVTIGAIAADWEGLRPRLSLNDVRVYDKRNDVAISLPQTEATLSWDSFLTFEIRLHRLEIDDANLDIKRLSNGVITVGGVTIDTEPGSGGGLSDWLLDQRRIVIRGGTISWTDEQRHAPTLTFSQAYLLISRFGIRHRFALSFTPPADLASPLDVRGYFDHGLLADAANSNDWSGQLYLKVDYVDLAAWHNFLDLPISLRSGSGALRTWLKFSPLEERQGRLTRLPQMVADIQLANVVTRVSSELPELTMTSLKGRVSASQGEQRDLLRLINLQVEAGPGQVFDDTNLDAEQNIDSKGQVSGGQLHADSLTLDTLAALGQNLPIGQDVREHLTSMAPRGVLQRFTYRWNGVLEKPSHFRLDTSFKGLSVRGQTPPAGDTDVSDGTTGFRNLDGSIVASDTSGNVTINAHDAAIDAPTLFERGEIPAKTLSAHATWQLNDHDLQVHIDQASLVNDEIDASINGSYRHGPHSGSRGPGYVDFSGRLNLSDLHQLSHYLPLTIGADARNYLARALISGSSDEGSYQVRGAMERFPFRTSTLPKGTAPNPEERFRVESILHNVTFDYAPSSGEVEGQHTAGGPASWPVITNAEATLLLDRDQFTSEIRAAKLDGASIGKMTVAVSDVGDHKAAVKVAADVDGAAQNFVRFINDSPLGDWMSRVTDKTLVAGDARMHVELLMPLADLDRSSVIGKVTFGGNDLTLFDWLPQISGVKGDLAFTENSVSLKNLSGKFLGGDVKVEANTAPDRVIEIRGSGNVSAQGLTRVPEFPFIERLAPHMNGSSAYRFSINQAAFGATEATAQNHGPHVVVDSTLEGMGIELPQPASKAPAAAMPLNVTIASARDNPKSHDRIDVHLGSVFNASFARDADATGSLQFTHMAYGVNAPATLSAAHANATLIAKELDADAWRDAIDEMSSRATPSNAEGATDQHDAGNNPFMPDAVSARVDDLKLLDKHFAKVSLTANHNNGNWGINLTSTEVAGRITWHDGAGSASEAQQNRLTARLDRLIVPTTAEKDVDKLLEPDSTPTEIPALDVIAEDFELGNKKFGKLELLAINVTTNGHHVWRLDKANLSNPDATFQAKGTWGPGGANGQGADITRMSINLDAKNVGGLLERLGLAGTIKDGTAAMTGNIAWQGTPLSIDYETLNGDLTMDVGRGEFLKVDPGIGKLLGVLSLQSMQRRLTFDFNDVFASGFAFDSIKAQATIKNGVASSQNFEMRGASAIVNIEGSADLAHETQTLHVKVLPQINLGAGSLAYALINPAIGLGTLVFQELLRNPISKALAYEYNVSGPWADPVIVRGAVTPREAPSKDNPPIPVAPAETSAPAEDGQKPATVLPAGPTPPDPDERSKVATPAASEPAKPAAAAQ
jgi:uncharacterized protein (TIGR02099 family)